MNTSLRVLIVEDSEDDAFLAVRALSREGFDVASLRVETAETMQRALDAETWDVVLSDYAMPHFSGPAALALAKRAGVDAPFIIVSGQVGEETAVEMMRAGAHDYVLKGNLTRLGSAVRRELEDAQQGRELRQIQAERALSAVQRDAALNQLRLQIERMPLAYLLFDLGGRLIDWNPAAERIFGFPRSALVGNLFPLMEIILPNMRHEADKLFDRLKRGETSIASTLTNLTRDGKTITCEWLLTALAGPDGDFGGFFCLVTDISKRLMLEEQYRQAQKMEAIGQLAGGVAHDFNNILTGIIGLSGLLVRNEPDEQRKADLREIRELGERAAGLTRQLLAFSRKQKLEPRTVNLNDLIANITKMLKRLIGENIELDFEPGAELHTVRVDPGQIEQVILNLAVNAKDAMPNGGRLSLRTSNAERTEASASAEHCVLLSATDTGCGIPEDIQPHIFEPFFTTKEVGKGTGLGLATVFGIISQHGGDIRLRSKVGVGTTFDIYLPAAEETASPAVEQPKPMPAHGTGGILLVEDDDTVRTLLERLLRQKGYTIFSAANPHDATWAFDLHANEIDLLLSDLVMPGGNGKQLYKQLSTRKPGLQVLFISGYPADAGLPQGLLDENDSLLPKPFEPDRLLSLVAEKLQPSLSPPGCRSDDVAVAAR